MRHTVWIGLFTILFTSTAGAQGTSQNLYNIFERAVSSGTICQDYSVESTRSNLNEYLRVMVQTSRSLSDITDGAPTTVHVEGTSIRITSPFDVITSAANRARVFIGITGPDSTQRYLADAKVLLLTDTSWEAYSRRRGDMQAAFISAIVPFIYGYANVARRPKLCGGGAVSPSVGAMAGLGGAGAGTAGGGGDYYSPPSGGGYPSGVGTTGSSAEAARRQAVSDEMMQRWEPRIRDTNARVVRDKYGQLRAEVADSLETIKNGARYTEAPSGGTYREDPALAGAVEAATERLRELREQRDALLRGDRDIEAPASSSRLDAADAARERLQRLRERRAALLRGADDTEPGTSRQAVDGGDAAGELNAADAGAEVESPQQARQAREQFAAWVRQVNTVVAAVERAADEAEQAAVVPGGWAGEWFTRSTGCLSAEDRLVQAHKRVQALTFLGTTRPQFISAEAGSQAWREIRGRVEEAAHRARAACNAIGPAPPPR